MRFVLFLAFIGLLAPIGRAQDGKVDKEIVKQVRAALSAKRAEDRDAQLAKIYALGADAWPSVKQGLEDGPYYQKPLVTAFGERHSGKHFDIRFMGKDNKPRGFSMWVPKSYDAKEALPVLFYLHQGPGHSKIQMGAERAGIGVLRFKKIADEQGFFVVAPYTNQGAEWWVEDGKRLVQWTLMQVRKRYKIDDNRIALLGAMGGGDAVWYLGQEMPGTWSCLMPMSGDPYEITGLIRPLFLGTLDRMDVLAGVPGVTNSTVGKKNALQFLKAMKPLVDKRMRITTGVYPSSQGDFGYLEKIRPHIAAFVMDKKRDPFPKEVDVETDVPNESLWLRNDGYDEKGYVFPGNRFPSTHLKWTAPARKDPPKRIGLELHKNPKWPVGLVIRKATGSAAQAQLTHGDVLLEIDGVPVYDTKNVKAGVEARNWGDTIKLVLAREFKESERNRALRSEKSYLMARIDRLERHKMPVPDALRALAKSIVVGEDAGDDEDEGCGCGDEIQISDDTEIKDDAPIVKGKEEKTFFMVVHRWVRLMPPVPVFVREDFGAVVDGKHGPDKGIKIGFVYPGSLADRSGLKAGDIVQAIGSQETKSIYQAGRFFRDFKFEEDTEPWVDFSITRKENKQDVERSITVRWEKPKASRVDAVWNEKDKSFKVITRKLSGFTLYFNDELIEPGREFHLYINNVPYRDLIDPATSPDYPKLTRGSDPAVADQLYRMRRKRAKVEGWKPDIKWAVEKYMETRDRSLVFGAKRSFDMKKMAAGFEKAKKAGESKEDKGSMIKKAYDEYKAGS